MKGNKKQTKKTSSQKNKTRFSEKNKVSAKSAQTKTLGKTEYFLLSLFLVSIFIVIFLNIQKQEKFSPKFPPAHHLSVTKDERVFQRLTTNLLDSGLNENLAPQTINPTKSKNLFLDKQNFPLKFGQFLILYKNNKLYSVNTRSRRFISSVALPFSEKQPQNLNAFQTKNGFLLSLYQPTKKSVNIYFFKISPIGRLALGHIFQLTRANPSFGVYLDQQQRLLLYNQHPLNKKDKLNNLFNLFARNKNSWQKMEIAPPEVWYDNEALLGNPQLHTFTVCQVDNNNLSACQQKHLLANQPIATKREGSNFYFWTNQIPLRNNPRRMLPTSKIFQINLNNILPNLVQVEGAPLGNQFHIQEDQLSALVYQKNDSAPFWHKKFSKNRVALLKFNLQKFQNKDSLVVNPKNYQITSYTAIQFSPSPFDQLTLSGLIALSPSSKQIVLYQLKKKNIFSADKIIGFYPFNNHSIIVLHQRKDQIIVTIFDWQQEKIIAETNLSPSTPFSGNKIFFPQPKIFSLQKDLFLSLPIVIPEKKQEKLFLLHFNPGKKSLTIVTRSNLLIPSLPKNVFPSELAYPVITNFIFPSNSNRSTFYLQKENSLTEYSWQNNQLKLHRSFYYTFRPRPRVNALTLARRRARIPGGAKLVNGHYVCAKKKHEYVGKSKKNNKGRIHLDLECCLDPDEYPNPWCTYRPGELSRTKYRFKDYKGRNIKIKKH